MPQNIEELRKQKEQNASTYRANLIFEIANKKIISPSDMREIIRHLGLGYIDLVGDVNKLTDYVFGNGHKPLDSRLVALETKLDTVLIKLDKRNPSNSFDKFKSYLVDKILPPLIVAAVLATIGLAIATELHLSISAGIPTPLPLIP